MARNLLLVAYGEDGIREGMAEVGRHAREFAPDVRPRVVVDRRYRVWRYAMALRPTLVFSPNALRRFKPVRGAVLQGRTIPKSVQAEAMRKSGIRVPDWTVLRGEKAPDLAGFGPYVVAKPDLGARGAYVRIVRSDRVRWKPVPSPLDPASTDLLVQEFIYTGARPVSVRVLTLFGQALYALRCEGAADRRRLRDRWAFDEGGISIVASARDSDWSLTGDTEILALARRVHDVFRDVPLLGVDIVRDSKTGLLHVLEINPGGSTWHFTSATGRGIQAAAGIDLAAQFDGPRKAARILAERARSEAR